MPLKAWLLTNQLAVQQVVLHHVASALLELGQGVATTVETEFARHLRRTWSIH
jgi:hypothetical protein